MKLNFPPPEYDEFPEGFQHLAEEADRLTDEIAMKVAKEVDDEITKAINMRVGLGWTPYQMANRLSRTIFFDGSEVISLDGEPMLHIGPFEMLPMGPSTLLTATRECTHLKSADDGPPN